MTLHSIQINDNAIADVCHRYHVDRLWLFGSVTRPDFHPDSDIDVLLDLQEPIGLFKLGGLQVELSEIFGREAHLTTLGGVPEEIRPGLLKSAMLQYAA